MTTVSPGETANVLSIRLRVIVLDVNPARLEFCRRQLEVEHTLLAGPDVVEELRQLTGGTLAARDVSADRLQPGPARGDVVLRRDRVEVPERTCRAEHDGDERAGLRVPRQLVETEVDRHRFVIPYRAAGCPL